MIFTNPILLYALSLALLPLIIHLIHLRKHKKLYFSNIYFLKKAEFESKKSKRINQWLLLLIRTIIIAALVFAFAQPVIIKGDKKDNQEIHFIVDNSLSMQAQSNNGSLYENAKTKAIELINLIEDQKNKISLHYTNKSKRTIAASAKHCKEDILQSEIKPGNKTINKIVSSLKKTNTPKHIIVLSDFQKNILKNDSIIQDTNNTWSLIHLKPNNLSNISIDTAWFNNPYIIENEKNRLNVKLVNHSKQQVRDLPVRILLNNNLYSAGTVNIDPKSHSTFESDIEFNTSGFIKLTAEIDDLPVIYDNTYYMGLYIAPKTTICEIGDQPGKAVKSLFNDTSRFDVIFQNQQNISLSVLTQSDVIILNHTIQLSEGIVSTIYDNPRHQNIIYIANTSLKPDEHNQILQKFNAPDFDTFIADTTTINKLNTNHKILTNTIEKIDNSIKYPEITEYYTIKDKKNSETILEDEIGNTLLLSTNIKNGNFYLFSFNAFEKQFSYHPLFIPVLYNSVTLTPKTLLPRIVCGEKSTFSVQYQPGNKDRTLLIEGNQITPFIPGMYRSKNNQVITIMPESIHKNGFYQLKDNDSTITILAANYNPEESVSGYYTENELENMFSSINNSSIFDINHDSTGILEPEVKLWKYFILLALALILSELALIKHREKQLKK